MKNLIDKTIQKIFISKDKQDYLSFQTDSGLVNFVATGDCCSESYFSDVNRIGNMIGQKVLDVQEIALMPEEITPIESRQDVDSVYGVKIITDKGFGLVVMRNSSNGYYGGEVESIKEIPEKEEMFEITKDFCALDLIKEKENE